jgi:hypothetical protein
LHERRLALVAEFAQEIHHSGEEVGEGTVGLKPERIEEVLLAEGSLFVERDGIEIGEKLVDIRRVGEVELVLPERIEEITSLAFSNGFQRDDQYRAGRAATVRR